MQTWTGGRHKVTVLAADGPALAGEASALDVLGDIYEADPDVIAIPAGRFSPEFWDLRSGLLGGFTQKLVNYGRRLAVVGDLSAELARSAALRDYVRECNRRGDVLFVADEAELRSRLG